MSNIYPAIKLNAKDNVIVARQPIAKGTDLPNDNIIVLMDIPEGHKIAIQNIEKNAPVKRVTVYFSCRHS